MNIGTRHITFIHRQPIIRTFILFVSILLLGVCMSFGQQTIQLDLATALRLGGASNQTLNRLDMEQALVKANYDKSKNWWIPELMTGIDMHQLWGNVMNSDGRIFTDVDRQSFSGAIGLHATFDFHEGFKNKKLNKYKITANSHTTRIEKNEFLLTVVEHYYQMVGANLEAQAYAQLIHQNDSIIQQLELLVDAGLQYNTDLLLAKSHRENHLIEFGNALLRLDEFQHEMILLLDLRNESNFDLDPNLELIDLVKEDSLVASPYLDFIQTSIDAKSFEFKSERSSIWIPTLRLNAYSSLFGDVFENIDPTHALNGGIGWKIPLSRLTGSDLRPLKIEKQMLDHQLEFESFKLTREIQGLKNDIALLLNHTTAAEKAVNYSLQALDETVQRQELGLARPFEIETVHSAVIQSKLNYIRGVVLHNIKQYHLYVKLGHDL